MKYKNLICLDEFISILAESPFKYVKGIEVLDLSDNDILSANQLTDLLSPLRNGTLSELYIAYNNYKMVPTQAIDTVSL